MLCTEESGVLTYAGKLAGEVLYVNYPELFINVESCFDFLAYCARFLSHLC